METLEIKIAHLEYLCDQLNMVIIDQGKRLARLENELRGITSSVEEIEMERVRNTNVKPPNYQ